MNAPLLFMWMTFLHKNPSFSYENDNDDEMVDYRLGYFGMVVAVHWVQLLIRGELYPVHDLRETGCTWR